MKLTTKEFINPTSGKPFFAMDGTTDDGNKVSSDVVIAKTIKVLNSLTNQQRAAVSNYAITLVAKGYLHGLVCSPNAIITDLRDGEEKIFLSKKEMIGY